MFILQVPAIISDSQPLNELQCDYRKVSGCTFAHGFAYAQYIFVSAYDIKFVLNGSI